VFVASALVALALIGTGLLWAHYGTAVFFETIRAGFTAGHFTLKTRTASRSAIRI